MNEMLYGNTGKRDEGINIDMQEALYQKLQSRTFVPKLKAMLNDRLQEGDKSFVFIGEVADKSGNFSVYGYNAKLENDSRGGDYGHYIAVPVTEKTVTVDIGNVGFLTEDGFVEYANTKIANDAKRFIISPVSFDIDVNAKKRIVNNLMETFLKVRKRKNVTFSFDDCPVNEFTSKALYVLCDLMKYLPYCMRKNISFISHVASNQRLPDMINLAAYPASSEFKTHDCISLTEEKVLGNDSLFAGYVEKVFAMSDVEREIYFEKIYEDIEVPALEKNVDVKSGLYLLDISVKELWTSGDIREAIEHIFHSVDDVLMIYPIFKEIAGKRLTENPQEVNDYIGELVAKTNTVKELETVYTKGIEAFRVCVGQLNDDIIELFRNHANTFIKNTVMDDALIHLADELIAINPAILDKECILNQCKSNLWTKPKLHELYLLYLMLKDKEFIDSDELLQCLEKCIENLILEMTDRYSEPKDKLSALENMYREFHSGYANAPEVKKVYERYLEKYISDVRAKAIDEGRDTLFEIKHNLEYSCEIKTLKDCIKRLSFVEVSADENLKETASDIYRKLSDKLFDQLEQSTKLTYEDFKELILSISPNVKKLQQSGVYDGYVKKHEEYVSEGLYQFVTVFEELINKVGNATSLTEVLSVFETDEYQTITRKYKKIAKEIMKHWLDKPEHKKFKSNSAFKKAEKELKNNYGKHLSHEVRRMYNFCVSSARKRKNNLIKLIVLGVIALVVLAGVVFGIVKLCQFFFGNDESATKQIPPIPYEQTQEKGKNEDETSNETSVATEKAQPTETPTVTETAKPSATPKSSATASAQSSTNSGNKATIGGSTSGTRSTTTTTNSQAKGQADKSNNQTR